MVYLLWTRTSLANFYEAVSLAFIKRNLCSVKFDFERHEAVNVSGPILRRCAMFRPPAYQYIHHLFIIFGLSSTSAEFFVGKMYLVRRDCMIAFFFLYQLPLWILPCLVDPNVPFMGLCSTDTHSRKPGQIAWQSVWWRAIMVPCAKVWITSLMKTFVNWIIARRRPDQMTSFPTKIACMWHDLVKEVLVEARG